jgi:hypothetical protein
MVDPPSYHQKKGHVCVPGRSPHHSWHRFRSSKTTSSKAPEELKVRRAKREGERGNRSLGRVRKEPEFVLQKWGFMLMGKKSLLEFMLMLGKKKSSKYP